MNKANELNESVIYQIAFSIICFLEGYLWNMTTSVISKPKKIFSIIIYNSKS